MSTELLPNIKQRYFDTNGAPLVGGKLYTYDAGTTTPLATYVDQAATTPNTNPIILDANGEADVFITSGVQYKFILKDSNDVIQWTKDNVSGVGFTGALGTGDVVGPAASVNNEVALFSGTTGKVIKRASGTGYMKATSGVVSYTSTVNLATEVTGTLPLTQGGTGQTTANNALNALLPDQSAANGKYLVSDGTNSSWITLPSSFITAIDTVIGSAPSAAGMSVATGTLTLQPADSTHPGILSIVAQTFAGVKTFLNNLLRSSASGLTAHAGGGQGSATALTKDINRVTTVATSGDSVILPAAVAGMEVIVINDGAASMDIFPASGEAIDALAANAAYALSTSSKNVRFICASSGLWKAAAGGGGSTSPLTTKGDIYTRSATADARLAVGSDGLVLTADAASTNGVKWAAASTGDVTGQAGSVDSEIALFSSTTGKVIKRATGTGFVKVTSGVMGTPNANVSLTTEVTGTLPIGNGGTGQTAKTAAFDALSPMTTSGDVIYGGASGTGTRLAKGSDGQVLTLASGLPTWSAASGGVSTAGFRNRIINGDMRFDTRNDGASQIFTAGAALAYCVDNFYAYCTGANVPGQRIAGAGTSQYRYQINGAASNTAIGFGQRIEAINCYDLNNTTATLSVDLANSVLTTVTWTLYRATTTADTFGTLASPTITSIATGTFTVNSTVTNYSTSISIPSAATTGLEVRFTVANQTSGSWTIGNIQLEPGSSATAFERRSAAVEENLCKRYLPRCRVTAVNDVFPFVGSAATTTAISGTISFPVTARVKPTGVVVSAAASFKLVRHSTGSLTASAVSYGSAGVDSASIQWTVTGATTDQTYFLHAVAAGVIYFTGCEL